MKRVVERQEKLDIRGLDFWRNPIIILIAFWAMVMAVACAHAQVVEVSTESPTTYKQTIIIPESPQQKYYLENHNFYCEDDGYHFYGLCVRRDLVEAEYFMQQDKR